ncbi:hypothetical protein Tco_0610847 [Tanacetum coccineum]
MSTSKTYQQSLADAGSENRPPILERGPYQFEMFIPNNSTVPKLQTAEDLQGDALLHYDAEMELMNLILLSFPNDIYNSVDACTSAKDMWKRVEREALVLVYNRFAQLMNDLERNDKHFPIVTINTKFLNSLQPKWLKYVTQVHLAKRLTVDAFDDLFDYLQQFEKLVNVSRGKKLEKSHNPLALVAHTGSSSRNTSSYYVTHPTSVVDYEDEYQQDDVHTNSEDPLTSAMLLLARAITQKFSTLTNNRLRTSSNTRNQAIIQGDRVNIQSRNSGHYARNYPKPRVRDLKYFMKQMLLAKQDEAGVILTDEQNDFLFADASRMEEIEELSVNICLIARIQPTDNTSDAGPSYDSAFISEVQSSANNENEEQMYPTHAKIINNTIGDGQIDSNIIFDSLNKNVNSGSIEKDTHVPNLCALEQLARNAYQEAKKQQIFPQKVQKQNTTLTRKLEIDTEDTLDDASKSQQKVYEKMNDLIAVANKQNCWTIDYAQINALYKDFVPQKELSAVQKYFPSSFIPSDKISNATPSIPTSMPSESPLIIELDKIKKWFSKVV